ncbi:MAG: glycosyl transferase family protein [Sphingomonadaceae bacterium]
MWNVLNGVAHELTLFAAVGFLIGGLDDLMVDAIWIGRSFWRRVAIYSRHARASAGTLSPACRPGRIAIFIPAWDESAVIGPMLRHALKVWGAGPFRIYVGVYPNDPATLAEVLALASPSIRAVVQDRPGPTTKADCLNGLWRALKADETRDGAAVKAIVLHDAEDVVHPSELVVFATLIERFAFVQLPVLPLVDRQSRWIGGHYLDEFAEAHGKTIVVREAIGAGIPAAGVGCAFDRAMLGRIADARAGAPFDADSLTEDYELGLRIGELGGKGAFVRLSGTSKAGLVAIRAHFPATLETAVRQKSRWIAGIALSGWDRLGWHGGLAERWMRIHDRRTVLGAVVLLVAYAALVLTVAIWLIAAVMGWPIALITAELDGLMAICGTLLIWRLAVRAFFVTRAYGWAEGLRAVPRVIVGNIVAIMAARRAVGLYWRMRSDGIVRWEKTAHRFPDHVPAQ